ncbi:MAG: pentapeptide repeat-containing protein [Cyanobacteria bacterium P01_F01_bin.143]
MTAKELLRRYAAGERDFTGVDLSEARLSFANLRNIILKDAYLGYVVMDDADLSFADLSGANMEGISLGESILQGANLTGAILIDAVFGQTYFGDANLSYADLTGADLTESTFFNVNLSHADLTAATGFYIGRFEGAIFDETIMPDGSIRSS